MALLKTNYKDDILLDTSGKRKYTMITNDDGTVSFVDATDYLQNGDTFGAADINATNTEVNEHFASVEESLEALNTKIDSLLIFSSEEKNIGTYFGKTLYEKTVVFHTGNAINTWVAVPELENIDRCIGCYGYTDPNENESWIIPSNTNAPYFSVETGTHRIKEAHGDTSYNNKICSITFRYTKKD